MGWDARKVRQGGACPALGSAELGQAGTDPRADTIVRTSEKMHGRMILDVHTLLLALSEEHGATIYLDLEVRLADAALYADGFLELPPSSPVCDSIARFMSDQGGFLLSTAVFSMRLTSLE